MAKDGYDRLKSALVLRDVLLEDLGLSLSTALPALSQVEKTQGVDRCADEGLYLKSLLPYTKGNSHHATTIDLQVRHACAIAEFYPRYAQYFALLLFCHWLDLRSTDEEAFLARLNQHLARRNAGWTAKQQIPAFTNEDLQSAAFWMATAAGKTHLLHACLVLLREDQRWDRIVLVTPTEALTRQHALKLGTLRQVDVFAYPADGDASAIGRLPPSTVIVLDINKLVADKVGDGVTIPTRVFSSGRNLVFVDEGHKGQGNRNSLWKGLQRDLAGIGSADPRQRGLVVEFSATFGQVADKEHAYAAYAKSIIFDYAYDRFHADGYGKDFWNVHVEAKGAAASPAQDRTLVSALVAYWHQLTTYRSAIGKAAIRDKGIEVPAPLWVLLGLSVIGGAKNENERAHTSDVITVLQFLERTLSRGDWFALQLGSLIALPPGVAETLPPSAREAIRGQEAKALADTIRADVFGWGPGDKPVFRTVRQAIGELGLGLLRGDHPRYYGVVNVGDPTGLAKAMRDAGLSTTEDVMVRSLFAKLDEADSAINVLIGSRRFAEGWDNYRASSLTLLRLGTQEGSLIIQMFGRVVRFAGRNRDGRRVGNPSDVLRPLQTAYIYGLRSIYLQSFLDNLYASGVRPETERNEYKVHECAPAAHQAPAQSLVVVLPERGDFTVRAVGRDGLGQFRRQTAVMMIRAGLPWGVLPDEIGEPGHDVGVWDLQPGTEIVPERDGELGAGFH